jgi:glutathione S-transferase
MKLYSNSFAPSPRRVRMFAAEKALALEVINFDFATNQHRQAEFLAINPVGDVPALVLEDGTALTESLAICRYLEEIHPSPPLFGTSTLGRARINECVDHLMFRLYVPATQAFKHTHAYWATRLTQVLPYGDVARALLREEFARLETWLSDGREFLVNSAFSMADIVAYTSVEFAKVGGVRVTADEPHLQAYMARLGARPSAKA